MKSKSLKVAAAQMKFRPRIADNVAFILTTIRAAAADGADVVLFPECAVTGYNVDFASLDRGELADAMSAIQAEARSRRCNVLVGTVTWSQKKRFNSLLVLDRLGREIFCYSKIHLTARDAQAFSPGNKLALFKLDGIPCTAIICHERRFPELVRLPVMMGARVLFHPNAGLDLLKVSRTKRGGRDGIAARAFENQIFYVFANSVGPQGDGLWSAGDSKIVAPSSEVLALADNRNEAVVMADLDLSLAGRGYAREALRQPAFLRPHWQAILAACRKQL